MMFEQIRRRLTLWYAAVLAAALILFGASVYVGVRHTLLQPIDARLTGGAQRLSQLWQLMPNSACRPLLLRLRAPLFRPPLYWACYDGGGTLLRASAVAQETPRFLTPGFITTALRRGQARAAINAGGDVGVIQQYALVVPNPGGNGTLGVVEVGVRVEGELQALRVLLTFLIAVGALILIGAALGGLFLAQRALQPARLASARQQSFIANAAHELRTPLTLLRADAEVLLRGRARLDPDDAALLEDIVAETAHMSALAATMLTLARLDAGTLQLERDVVDLAAVAAAVARRAGAWAGQEHIALCAEAPAPVLMVGDRALLEQAALVLIDNAVKYNRPGGGVTVRACQADGRAVLEVSDSGEGIAPEHLPHLGERFYRVDKARSREAGGAGLGLSIARGIAELHRGTLTLRSQPGQGTTATLAFPAARPD